MSVVKVDLKRMSRLCPGELFLVGFRIVPGSRLQRSAQTVRERLEPLIRRTPPVPDLRKKDTVWVAADGSA